MAHLYTAYRCNFCSEIPEVAPIFYCPNRHHYCNECFRKLQRLYQGNIDGAGCCLMCRYTGIFEKSDVNTDFLRKLKAKPGIGRPYRYNPTRLYRIDDNTYQLAPSETLYPNEANQGDGCLSKNLRMSGCISVTGISKRPLTCLHDNCRKSVALSSLVDHFKHEHASVKKVHLSRGEDFRVKFDALDIEHDRSLCLAMITVYEIRETDLIESKSSNSIVENSDQLPNKIPVNTLWLMMSGSKDFCPTTSYVIIWIYCNREDKYWYTIDISPNNDKICLSSFCRTIGLHENRTAEDVAKNMNCLFLSYGSLIALIAEGEQIQIRGMLH